MENGDPIERGALIVAAAVLAVCLVLGLWTFFITPSRPQPPEKIKGHEAGHEPGSGVAGAIPSSGETPVAVNGGDAAIGHVTNAVKAAGIDTSLAPSRVNALAEKALKKAESLGVKYGITVPVDPSRAYQLINEVQNTRLREGAQKLYDDGR